MDSTSHPGAMVSAMSVSFMLGILGTKISPPCICSMQLTTKRTPCSSVSQKRVMRGSVMVILPRLRCSMKHRDHAAPAAHNVAVAGATEAGVLRPGVGVGLDEHFLGAKFGGAVKVDGIDRFVGAQGQNALHALVDGGVDHVAAAHDVGLNGFKGVVFAGRHLFERGRMDHDRDPGKSALQPLRVAHIADEVAQAGMIEARRSACRAA